ncbi:MAG: DUF3048 domain-containing protein, partial [Clostridia bacterium]|nr:DUF3048 domain-containing protein [Clostridia bacterium]
MRRWMAAALSLMLVLAGCAKAPAPAEETPPPVVEKPAEEKPVAMAEDVQAFFDSYVNTNERPVAVMIDNDDNNARPQAGLEEAYLIYEMVVEGGATRFMALFRDAETKKIGPVRSSRHYFLDYALENDVIYTHFGYSPKALSDIPALGVKNINGVEGSDSGIFWRDTTYTRDWHSAFTSMEKIKARAEQKKYALETEHKNAIQYATKYFTPASDKKAEKPYTPTTPPYSRQASAPSVPKDMPPLHA